MAKMQSLKQKKMRNDIIKSLIKPYYRRESYTNKGNKFFKDLGFIQIEIDIQSQRYYKNENSENFRINYNLLCREFKEKYGVNKNFGCHSISEKTSWIEINQNINLKSKKEWLLNELEKTELEVIEKSEANNLINSWKEHETDLRYIFLLDKFKPKEHNLLMEKFNLLLSEIDNKINELLNQKKKQEKRENSLDKELLLKGINLKLKTKNNEKAKIVNILNNQNNRHQQCEKKLRI